MKKFLKPYRHLAALFAVIVMAFAIVQLGAPVASGVAIVALWQLSQFALSKRCGVCFNTVLTPEQVKEFGQIITDLSQYKDLFPPLKDLGTVEGGFAAIKKLPELIKTQEGLITTLRTDLDNYRRAQISMKQQIGVRRDINGQPQVSPDCAKFLGGIAILGAMRKGRLKGDLWEGLAKDCLQIETKASLTASDIPLPTQWSAEVVELVSMYGDARRYGTVYPLGAGTVKLPQLGTDTTFGLISMSAAITAKSPTVVFVTFTPEKYGGLITLPDELDADSIVDIGQFVARYAARQLARAEDQLFWACNGTTHGDPEGLTISTITNSKVVQMASTKTHYSDATLANLRALRAAVDEGAIRTGAYYLNTTFEQHLSGLNTAGDKPYIANGVNGASLDGFPIRWIPIMPAYSTGVNASKVFALFGDASYQYLGVRSGIRFDASAEAGFTTDETLIRALERFTIGLMATGAIAGLDTAAS